MMEAQLNPENLLERVVLGCYAFMVENLRDMRAMGFTRLDAMRVASTLNTLERLPPKTSDGLVQLIGRVSILMWSRPIDGGTNANH